MGSICVFRLAEHSYTANNLLSCLPIWWHAIGEWPSFALLRPRSCVLSLALKKVGVDVDVLLRLEMPEMPPEEPATAYIYAWMCETLSLFGVLCH